jgi:hypothetical protein
VAQPPSAVKRNGCSGWALPDACRAGLRRPDPLRVARRVWPWAAVIIGTAWLFLLTMGFLRLILLVTASCVLIVRVRKRHTPDPKKPPTYESVCRSM